MILPWISFLTRNKIEILNIWILILLLIKKFDIRGILNLDVRTVSNFFKKRIRIRNLALMDALCIVWSVWSAIVLDSVAAKTCQNLDTYTRSNSKPLAHAWYPAWKWIQCSVWTGYRFFFTPGTGLAGYPLSGLLQIPDITLIDIQHKDIPFLRIPIPI